MNYTTIYKLTHPRTSQVIHIGSTKSALQVEINELVKDAMRGREGEVYDKVRELLDENLRPYIDMICQKKLSETQVQQEVAKEIEAHFPKQEKEVEEETPKPKRRRPSRRKSTPPTDEGN